MKCLRLVVLSMVVWVTFPAAGQQPYDTLYLKSYKDKFFVWPVLKRRELSFRLEDPSQVAQTAEFKPNNSYGLGLGVYLFDLGLEFVFGMPQKQELESQYGTTRATDLQLNILSRRWGGDVVYQRYKGYYLSNPTTPVLPGDPYPQRPDIVTENLGVNGIYAFNAHRYSLRSSFTFADRQLKSAGGFLIAGSFNLYEIDGDSAINIPFAQPGQIQSFTALDYRTYAVAPGYGHNFVIRNNFFISLLLAIGPAVQDFRFRDSNNVLHTDTRINSYIDFRSAIGYSTDKFFTGITLSSQTRNVVFEDVRFGSVTTTARILFGWRFTEWGFLKHSVWELLPPWRKKKEIH